MEPVSGKIVLPEEKLLSIIKGFENLNSKISFSKNDEFTAELRFQENYKIKKFLIILFIHDQIKLTDQKRSKPGMLKCRILF